MVDVSKKVIDIRKEKTVQEFDNFVEQVWFVYGLKIGPFYFGFLEYQNDGEPCQVKFDPLKAFFGKKILGRIKSNKRMLGFYHSHPSGIISPSSTDDATMDAWVKAMGKDMLCGIMAGEQQTCFVYRRLLKRKAETDYIAVSSKIFFKKYLFVDTREAMRLISL